MIEFFCVRKAISFLKGECPQKRVSGRTTDCQWVTSGLQMLQTNMSDKASYFWFCIVCLVDPDHSSGLVGSTSGKVNTHKII